MNLHEAYDLHRPDKPRAFIDAYAEILRPPWFANVLELGIQTGNSLRMWREICPKVTGLDRDMPSKPGFRHGVRIVTGNQADAECLGIVARIGQYDLIVDDCSHLFAETLASFSVLFPSLRVGGWYVIEDIAAYGGENVQFAKRALSRQQINVYGPEHSQSKIDCPFAEIRLLPNLLMIRRGDGGGGAFDGLPTTHDGAVPWIPAEELVRLKDLMI